MQQHPIDNMMQTTMENIRSMVDVNTVVGAPVTGTKGTTIIPISKVSFGFIAGGGEYAADESRSRSLAAEGFPFAGGTVCRVRKVNVLALLLLLFWGMQQVDYLFP